MTLETSKEVFTEHETESLISHNESQASTSHSENRLRCRECQRELSKTHRRPSLILNFSIRRLAVDVLIILLLTSALTFTLVWNRSVSSLEARAAFTEIILESDRRSYGLMHTSPYVGDNFPRADAAWDDLLANMNSRVSKAELEKQELGLDSAALSNGGYLAWLGVFHELHCIKMLRKMNYRDHYHPNATEAESLDLRLHADHCIDQLREASMCRADTESLTTFERKSGYSKPVLSPHRPLHQCVSWPKLMESIRDRAVPVDEIGLITI